MRRENNIAFNLYDNVKYFNTYTIKLFLINSCRNNLKLIIDLTGIRSLVVADEHCGLEAINGEEDVPADTSMLKLVSVVEAQRLLLESVNLRPSRRREYL